MNALKAFLAAHKNKLLLAGGATAIAAGVAVAAKLKSKYVIRLDIHQALEDDSDV